MKRVKRKISFALAVLLFSAFIFSSCGSFESVFENFFGAVKKLDFKKAEDYITFDSKDYIDALSSYSSLLSEEQKETALALFSFISFSYDDNGEEDGARLITLTYVDFSALISAVNGQLAVGEHNATYYIKEFTDSGRILQQYTKRAEGILVKTAKDDGGNVKISFGNAGDNSVLTGYLGIDTFLRWYSAQR